MILQWHVHNSRHPPAAPRYVYLSSWRLATLIFGWLCLVVLCGSGCHAQQTQQEQHEQQQPDEQPQPSLHTTHSKNTNYQEGDVVDDGTVQGGKSGTELMAQGLATRLPVLFQEKFHIIKSRVRVLSDTQTNILWIHDLPQDPEQQHLRDVESRRRFDKIVFVSEWQRHSFAHYFQDEFFLKDPSVVVLRNAIVPFALRKNDNSPTEQDKNDENTEPNRTIRLIYHTTPHRGLTILWPVFEQLYSQYSNNDDKSNSINIQLDLYSSFAIYGWPHKDEPFEHIFEACRYHLACHYHGAVSNDEIRKALQKAHIFAYPSLWFETSCIACIEAMSAGLHVVAPNLGALSETLGMGRTSDVNGEGITIYEFADDQTEHATRFTASLKQVIDTYWEPSHVFARKQQQIMAAQRYDWGCVGVGGRMEEWTQVLASTLDQQEWQQLLTKTEPKPASFHTLPPMATPSSRQWNMELLQETSSSNNDNNKDTVQQKVDALLTAGRQTEMQGNPSQAIGFYQSAHSLNSNHVPALVAFGNALLLYHQSQQQGSVAAAMASKGAELLERALTMVSQNSMVFMTMAPRLAFYFTQQHQPERATYWLDSISASNYPHDDCWQIYQATSVPHLPASAAQAKERMTTYHAQINHLLAQDHLICEDAERTGSVFPVAYYDVPNIRNELSQYTRLLSKAFPWLNYVAPNLVRSDDLSIDAKAATVGVEGNRIKVGVLSSFFNPQSSIWGSFGMTMRFLQTHPRLDLSLIYYPREYDLPSPEQVRQQQAQFAQLSIHPETNIYLYKLYKGDPHALTKNRRVLQEAQFDILLYLDLFMTTEVHQLALAKLAPVQVCTHGHPVTSGIPRGIMDYYISWQAAELPDYDQAQDFYTEELMLLPGNVTWEYFEPRSAEGRTRVTDKSFGHYPKRHKLDFLPNVKLTEEQEELLRRPGATWYFCAQASFKFDPDFDVALGLIQTQDPHAVIILIELLNDLNELSRRLQQRFFRLQTVDLDRVVFLPRLAHDHLMTMYKLSDVTLDSFYFGGDTTTREAFEVGAPVITLPHKTIGQRWTQAYYHRMGMTDLIARDRNHYAEIAVEVANRSPDEKKALRQRIVALAHEKLFRSDEGYPEWAKALIDIARRPRRWHWKDATRVPPESAEMHSPPNPPKNKVEQQQEQQRDEL